MPTSLEFPHRSLLLLHLLLSLRYICMLLLLRFLAFLLATALLHLYTASFSCHASYEKFHIHSNSIIRAALAEQSRPQRERMRPTLNKASAELE